MMVSIGFGSTVSIGSLLPNHHYFACVESGGVDVFLTTDDQLLRQAAAHSDELRIQVENPLTWLREVS